MRKGGILAGRYAKALFQVGKERNILDRLHADISVFARALRENQGFAYFFDSPEVTRQEKKAKIQELFGDSVSEVFFHFVMVVLDKGRQTLFPEIAEAFNGEMDIYNNRVKALVTASVELTPEMKNEIRAQLAKQLNKEVVLIPEVDESLLGGIKITIDGKVIDGSIKGKLQKMRQFLLEQSAAVLN